MMDGRQHWCRVVILGPDRTALAGWQLKGPGLPDLSAIEDLAQLALLARRFGGSIIVCEASTPTRELIELAGLGVEMEGQTELGKEPLGVEKRQEETHLGDAPL